MILLKESAILLSVLAVFCMQLITILMELTTKNANASDYSVVGSMAHVRMCQLNLDSFSLCFFS